MFIRPFLGLLRNHQLFATLRANALYKPFYTVTWLAAAKENGILELLAAHPASLEQIAAAFCRDAKSREALEAWLQLGLHVESTARSQSPAR